MNPTETYLRSAGELLHAWAASLDDELRENLNDALQTGGMLKIETALSRAGHVGTELVLITPTGERLELAWLDLSGGVRQ